MITSICVFYRRPVDENVDQNLISPILPVTFPSQLPIATDTRPDPPLNLDGGVLGNTSREQERDHPNLYLRMTARALSVEQVECHFFVVV